ncbi:FAD/NAD(P)-binding protein [Glarea lozoyensis ATCC 20868]|uniref:FAD/NAD(P)-binding protein n=1 Tax=Glarea lozoyensis (strain ATCC 20868 / MF5171) TaxID=1116229 RepID=S3DAR4_GLAL2|nr:FAD/NAD(P)-binding protein [Glarea lozoyensis ATCC 20868]EPE34775.1 FAD/NAD(P)-binding protein [Glarea lozoyensis ATCC 20868]
MPSYQPPPLRIAIIGGGPGGLGSAIALSSLPNVVVTLYERAKELREIGAGIRVGFNGWKVLELLGADEDVRGHVESSVLHRNGLSGEIVKESPLSKYPIRYHPQRVRRTRLQSALISKVPEGVIKLNKKLVGLEDLSENGVKLTFEDGSEVIADLVVGGDGIRSVVRQHVFPEHTIQFTGTTIFRVLVPVSSVSNISDMMPSTQWWHGPTGHFYCSLVDDPAETDEKNQLFEIAARKLIDPSTDLTKKFSWGVPATNARVEGFFTDYDPRVLEALSVVPEGHWKEFSAFAGPRLEKLTAWNEKIVLIGDASHPLSGAFGSGATFAMEDGWILARAIEYSRGVGGNLSRALEVFDSIRSPYYARMYTHLDEQKQKVQNSKATNQGQSFELTLRTRIAAFGGEEKLSWIYGNDIGEVWSDFLRTSEKSDA